MVSRKRKSNKFSIFDLLKDKDVQVFSTLIGIALGMAKFYSLINPKPQQQITINYNIYHCNLPNRIGHLNSPVSTKGEYSRITVA